MGRLTLEDNYGEQSGGERVGKGALIKTASIINVIDYSNYPNQTEVKVYGKNGFTPELCLEIKFQDESYEGKMSLFGKFKKNSKGLITAWDPWNNNVQRLLAKLLGEQAQIEDNLSIPQDVLDKLLAKEFKYVNYITNRTYQSDNGEKNSWQKWGKIFTIEQTTEEITEEWNNNLPYLNDYSPESLQNYDSNKPDPWNEKKPEGNTAMSSETTKENSDDDII